MRCWHALPDYNFRAFSLSEAEAAYIIIQSAERQKQSLPITTCGTSNNRQRRQGEWWPWLRFWTSFQPWRLFSQLSALLPAVIAFFCPPSCKLFADQMSWVVSDKKQKLAASFSYLKRLPAQPAEGEERMPRLAKYLAASIQLDMWPQSTPHTHTHIFLPAMLEQVREAAAGCQGQIELIATASVAKPWMIFTLLVNSITWWSVNASWY